MKIFTDNKEVNFPPQWNLLTGTADFSGTDWNFEKGAKIDKNVKAPNGNVTVDQPDWSQASRTITITKDKYYTLSVDSNNVNSAIYIQDTNGNDINNKLIKIIFSNTQNNSSWFKKITTFKCLENAQVKIMCTCGVENYVANMKLELGTFATAWMPAIADLMLKNQNGEDTATS